MKPCACACCTLRLCNSVLGEDYRCKDSAKTCWFGQRGKFAWFDPRKSVKAFALAQCLWVGNMSDPQESPHLQSDAPSEVRRQGQIPRGLLLTSCQPGYPQLELEMVSESWHRALVVQNAASMAPSCKKPSRIIPVLLF